ncbi:Uma2 family endonuclease [Staphylospora marina]|uniref:Uma2 family endonuclease n=1 Tax=Staphylospora marina TaxID=2490858 RepID=UPI001F14DF16|nr:Uma2 family endonuclease [Staphylospora marina]
MKAPTFHEGIKYSYRDYLQWDDEQSWEIIDGVPHNMAPAPSSKHQEVLGNVFALFHQYLKGKRCKVYIAPFEVRLSESGLDEETFNIVQPDLTVVCDRKKIDERGCNGTPDLIVEVLSPGMAAKRDKIVKFELYERFGVKEYWIVDPYHENVEVFLLEEGKFGNRQVYVKGDVFAVSLFGDLLIDLNAVFQEESFE